MGHRIATRKREMKVLDGKKVIKWNLIKNKDGR